jgi:hypothetical protein
MLANSSFWRAPIDARTDIRPGREESEYGITLPDVPNVRGPDHPGGFDWHHLR